MDIVLTFLIREKRKELGISLRALDELSGISRSFISEIERGVRTPSVLTICKLAKAMNVPVTDLFWYK